MTPPKPIRVMLGCWATPPTIVTLKVIGWPLIAVSTDGTTVELVGT